MVGSLRCTRGMQGVGAILGDLPALCGGPLLPGTESVTACGNSFGRGPLVCHFPPAALHWLRDRWGTVLPGWPQRARSSACLEARGIPARQGPARRARIAPTRRPAFLTATAGRRPAMPRPQSSWRSCVAPPPPTCCSTCRPTCTALSGGAAAKAERSACARKPCVPQPPECRRRGRQGAARLHDHT